MRIRLNDIDAAGVVFGPRLIALAHEAAEDALRVAGLDFAMVLKEGAYALPLVRIESDFAAPVRHGDELVPTVVVARTGGKSFTLEIRLDLADGTRAATVTQTQVVIGLPERRPMALPAEVVAALGRLTPPGPPPAG
jgi:acyl-CoA thioesterase FadM